MKNAHLLRIDRRSAPRSTTDKELIIAVLFLFLVLAISILANVLLTIKIQDAKKSSQEVHQNG